MSVHSPAALARSGACSIQTISSRSLLGTVTARPRLTRSAKRARIIPELYPGHAGQQHVAVIEPCSDGSNAREFYRHVGREAFGFNAVEHSQREDNHKARRAFRSAPNLAARPRLRVTRSEIAIHEFGRHRHHDQSKNPAHHTTGSKLAPRGVVLKFDLDAIRRLIMQTMAHRRTISVDLRFLL